MARRPRTTRGAAWNRQVFNSTARARSGGPVYRAIPSIVSHSSKRSLYHEARRRGWAIIRLNQYWVLYDKRIPVRQLLGPQIQRGSI